MNDGRYRQAERALWASLGLAPEERLVPLPTLGTAVRVQVLGDGPPVLFVHGGAVSGANWAPLLPHLAGFRCLVLDRPGCGLSPPTTHPARDLADFERYADTLIPDVLAGLELDRAPVVATSLGGYYTVRAAAAHPDRIERIVEFGYMPGAPVERVPLSMRVATLPGLRRVMMALPPTPAAIRAILRQLGLGPALDDGRITPEFFEWFRSLWRDTPTMRNDSNGPPELLKPDEGALSVGLLAAVNVPVRFVWSRTDPIGGAEVARSFAAGFPHADLELWDDASHAPWVDD
ncbi:MAG: alpha/beta fold hydrolase, partial [Ilumatobacteraceae bacterium]